MTSFQTAAAALGGLLVLGALVSGLAHRSFLSLAAVYVLAGFVLGETGVVSFHANSGFVSDLATVALIVILFRDGLEVEGELLRGHWQVPLRHLAVGHADHGDRGRAAVARRWSASGWTESLLLGALLTPTDPVLSSRVVTDERVPALVRHTLNLESGLNDGLALPGRARVRRRPGSRQTRLRVVALRAAGRRTRPRVRPRVRRRRLAADAAGRPRAGAISSRQKALYSFGLAFATYGLTVLPPRGNGFIAVFVAAIVVGNRRAGPAGLLRRARRGGRRDRQARDLRRVRLAVHLPRAPARRLGRRSAVVAGTLLLARPIAIFAALAGTRVPRPDRIFMSWFGPKGVATITFSLLILSRNVHGGERIFDLAALAVFCSILVHGASEIPGIRWLARQRRQPRPAETPAGAR